MAGRPKQGIDYAGWSVNIFDGDTKIDKLLDAQGWTGFSVYFFLCQMAYKFDGYFYRWCYDDSSTTARRMGGGLRAKSVEETVRYCLQIGLFEKRLFDEWNILTSRGIQRRFLAAIQGRRVKSVIADYWLLDDEESKGLEKCASDGKNPAAKGHLQGADGDLQAANAPKSKGKESKVKDTPPTPPPGGWGFGEGLNDAVSEWLTYKSERRKPVTPVGLRQLLALIGNQARLHGESAVENLLRQCMASGYDGIVWNWLEEAGHRPGAGRTGPGPDSGDGRGAWAYVGGGDGEE